MSNFFAFMNRMKLIERWSLMRNTVKENISEHSHDVAIIAHCLGVINNVIFDGIIDPQKIAVIALYHEAAEVITGDLPTPIKYFNRELNTAYKDIEEIAVDKLLGYLPDELKEYYEEILKPDTDSYEYKLVKAADKIAALIKCIDEEKSGNKEFLAARDSIERQIARFNYPEVKYFMDNFLEAYTLTLDDLSE